MKSISVKLGEVEIPKYIGEVKMKPFYLSSLEGVPNEFKEVVTQMIESLPVKVGKAYLTVDGRLVKKYTSHRKDGKHIDGNYIEENSNGSKPETFIKLGYKHHKDTVYDDAYFKDLCYYNRPTNGQPYNLGYNKGWELYRGTEKAEFTGVKKLQAYVRSERGTRRAWQSNYEGATISDGHRRSYETETGGLLMASTYQACRGWHGEFEGVAGEGGCCDKIEGLGTGFLLEANCVYYCNSQFIHESIPVDKDVERVIVRITLPENYPILPQLIPHLSDEEYEHYHKRFMDYVNDNGK